MRSSSSLTLQQSTRYVTKKCTPAFVSAAKSFRFRSCRKHDQPFHFDDRPSTVTIRQFSSSRQGRNHLQDVKEFTALNRISIWQSTSNNPYENLAIENYLLRNSDPASRILFTYVNWPCVVIGRNQNPWLECNLSRMQEGLPYHALREDEETENGKCRPDGNICSNEELIPLALVRRRSGGGTVIHDAGNLNFSFIVPNDKDFTRDKHAELVVTMLQRLRSNDRMSPYYSSVRVNERHDIVMKPKTSSKPSSDKEFKVSGSAFKLTRGRALHHGTILHSSPNILEQIGVSREEHSTFSEILSSPAKPYLEAKGVGSVRSPVHNLFRVKKSSDRLAYNRKLQLELQSTFKNASNVGNIPVQSIGTHDCTEESNKPIFDDIQELLTKEWQFCQTPSFEYSSSHEPDNVHIHFQVKHGIIGAPTVKSTNGDVIKGYESLVNLEGRKLHEISDWSDFIPSSFRSSASIISHLMKVFPNVDLAPHKLSKSIESGAARIVAETEEIQRNGTVIEKRSADGRVEIERKGESLVVER